MLIVEDNGRLLLALHNFLRAAFPGIEFRDVMDGEGALAACKFAKPDLVLMDKCLPDADGIELTAHLRTLYPGIGVIVMSYRTEAVYAKYALTAGACAYISKDRIDTELVPAIAAAIGIPAARDIGAC